MDCARAVRTQDGWVAEDEGAVVGFATWERRTDSTAEVTWMAVRRDRRHCGVGSAIIERRCDQLQAKGFKLARAMTAAETQKLPSEGPDVYEATGLPERPRGFEPLVELDIWETDIALLQVRPLR